MRRALITGASGFAGEHLARAFARAGYAVTAQGFTKAPTLPSYEGAGASPHRAVSVDLTHPGATRAMLTSERPEVVVHCAALTDVLACERDPKRAEQSIAYAAETLAEPIRAHLPDCRVVALSTDLVFDGENPPYSDASPARPLSVYGRAKHEAEGALLDRLGPHAVALRAALLYGPPATHKASFLGWMSSALREGKPLELFTDEHRTPLYVGDLAAACLALCAPDEASPARNATGALVAGGADTLSRFEMGQRLAEVLGVANPNLVARSLRESTYGAPRPANVALDSTRLWSLVGHRPLGFTEGVRASVR